MRSHAIRTLRPQLLRALSAQRDIVESVRSLGGRIVRGDCFYGTVTAVLPRHSLTRLSREANVQAIQPIPLDRPLDDLASESDDVGADAWVLAAGKDHPTIQRVSPSLRTRWSAHIRRFRALRSRLPQPNRHRAQTSLCMARQSRRWQPPRERQGARYASRLTPPRRGRPPRKPRPRGRPRCQ